MLGFVQSLGPLVAGEIPDTELLVDPGTSMVIVLGVMALASATLWLAQRRVERGRPAAQQPPLRAQTEPVRERVGSDLDRALPAPKAA